MSAFGPHGTPIVALFCQASRGRPEIKYAVKVAAVAAFT
jgi:hypothetical protein